MIVIYGAGGHGKVINDVLSRSRQTCSHFFDRDSKASLPGLLHLGDYRSDVFPEAQLVIAIGDNTLRSKLTEKVRHHFAIVCDPTASISQYAFVQEGTVVLHHSIIQANTNVGRHVIINSAAVVDHDCTIGDFSHIAPNATLCGEVRVGKGCLVGAGAVVLPGSSVPDGTIVKAGTVYGRIKR